MESCITNRLNSLCVLYCNLEKKVNEHLSKNEVDSTIKEEIKQIKGELSEIKKENDSLIKGELEIVNGELKIIKNNNNSTIKEELDSIKNTINSITRELRHQKNINLESTPNYLEYTLLYADFENCGICMYCPSEPYEPDNDISIGPIIDNEKYTILKNILNN
jgi:hypothetical protein